MQSSDDKPQLNFKSVHIFGIGALAILAYAVWPTPYILSKEKDGTISRVNRFSGVTEVSTGKGWTSTEELSRKERVAESERKTVQLEAQKAETEKKLKLAEPKTLPAVTFGSKNQYSAQIVLIFRENYMHFKVTASPDKDELSTAVLNPNDVPLLLLSFQDSTGFSIEDQIINNRQVTRDSDGKGGTTSIDFEGKIPISEDAYQSLTRVMVKWYF